MWINIENGERGKSLVIMPQWSNTLGLDCRFSLTEAKDIHHEHASTSALNARSFSKDYNLHGLINNSITAGATKEFLLFLSFSGNLFQDNHII